MYIDNCVNIATSWNKSIATSLNQTVINVIIRTAPTNDLLDFEIWTLCTLLLSRLVTTILNKVKEIYVRIRTFRSLFFVLILTDWIWQFIINIIFPISLLFDSVHSRKNPTVTYILTFRMNMFLSLTVYVFTISWYYYLDLVYSRDTYIEFSCVYNMAGVMTIV